MIKGNSKDKELNMEINTRLSKEHFFPFLQEKLKIQIKHHWDSRFVCVKTSLTHL